MRLWCINDVFVIILFEAWASRICAGNRKLPVVIGEFEAQSIAWQKEKNFTTKEKRLKIATIKEI